MDNEISYGEFECFEQILSEDEARDLSAIQREFLESYVAKKDTMSVEEWLRRELHHQLPERTSEEISVMSVEILESLRTTERQKESLQKAVASGRSKESWFASTLKQATSHMSAQESVEYLQGLDDAVKKANEAMYDTITTKAGVPNQNTNLNGFIAEQHHANSYNMKARAAGGDLYAEVLKPKPGEAYRKNSVDVVLKDSGGKIVRRYQLKYGKTAKDTIRMIQEGDYRGQQLVVPEEQVEAVQKAFPDRKVSCTIGDGDVTSKPLTKDEAKAQQEKAQRGDFLNVDWNEYSTKDIAIGIGMQAGQACLQGAVIGAGMNIAGKVWNGEPINGEEVIESAITSGADFGVKVATAGALKTAVEKNVIKVIPKGTPGSTFANIAFVAIENVKVLGKVATGELTVKEGIDTMQQTTVACVAGLATSTAIGAAIGTVLGPVGTFIGGTIGYMIGSGVAKNVVKGAQKIRDTAVSYVKSAVNSIRSGVSNFAYGLASILGF